MMLCRVHVVTEQSDYYQDIESQNVLEAERIAREGEFEKVLYTHGEVSPARAIKSEMEAALEGMDELLGHTVTSDLGRVIND